MGMGIITRIRMAIIMTIMPSTRRAKIMIRIITMMATIKGTRGTQQATRMQGMMGQGVLMLGVEMLGVGMLGVIES